MSLFDEIPPLPPEAFLPPAPPALQLTDEQEQALAEVSDWLTLGDGPFFSLRGPAGTGKTTLVKELTRRHPGSLAAMTGKAALRMSQLSGYGASTLHKILYYPPAPDEDLRFTRLREPPSDFVVVDEASMMTPSVFEHCGAWAKLGVKMLLVGDDYQLPPVITGQELRDHGEDYSVFSKVRGVGLKTVMRNAGGVLRAATRVRETGEIQKSCDWDGEVGYDGYGFVYSMRSVEDAVSMYLSDPDDHMLITWRNAVRMSANRLVREQLGHSGELPDDGEPVLIKKNSAMYLNGEIVTCGGFEAGPTVGSVQTLWMTVPGSPFRLLVSFEGGNPEKGGEFFDGAMPWIENWRAYHADLKKMNLPEPTPITWGYVLTAHSAQGSQARRTTVFLSQGDDNNQHFRKLTTLPDGTKARFSARWMYTAQTRSTERTTVILG